MEVQDTHLCIKLKQNISWNYLSLLPTLWYFLFYSTSFFLKIDGWDSFNQFQNLLGPDPDAEEFYSQWLPFQMQLPNAEIKHWTGKEEDNCMLFASSRLGQRVTVC